MAPNLLERLQARIELFRLEQRYTRSRRRRSTFVSNAIYVDGEYIYQTPNATGSSTGSSGADSATAPSSPRSEDMPPGAGVMPGAAGPTPTKQKRLSRFGSMPGFGSRGNEGAR